MSTVQRVCHTVYMYVCMCVCVKTHRIKLVFIPRERVRRNRENQAYILTTILHTILLCFWYFWTAWSNIRMERKNTNGIVQCSQPPITITTNNSNALVYAYAKFKVITLQTWTNCKIKHKTDLNPHTRARTSWMHIHIISFFAWYGNNNRIFRSFQAYIHNDNIFDWITIIGFVKWIVALLIWFTGTSSQREKERIRTWYSCMV